MTDPLRDRADRRPAVLLGLFAVLALANAVTANAGVRVGEVVTKPLLMPVLVAYVLLSVSRQTPWRLVVAGLAFGTLGDAALLIPAGFLPGMGAFAAGHVCYIAAFGSAGAVSRLRRLWWVPVGYGLLWTVLIGLLWSGLDVPLRVPILLYSLLLATMAMFAAGSGPVAAVGGLLFLLSDAALGLGLAHRDLVPDQSILIMPTYLAGQFLLAESWRARYPRARLPRPAPVPAVDATGLS
jgi:uncharacterized membrane protein YhhN